MEFLPPNTTAILLLKKQGVICNLKILYRSCVLRNMVLCSDSSNTYTVDLRSAAGMLPDSRLESVEGCYTRDSSQLLSPRRLHMGA